MSILANQKIKPKVGLKQMATVTISLTDNAEGGVSVGITDNDPESEFTHAKVAALEILAYIVENIMPADQMDESLPENVQIN